MLLTLCSRVDILDVSARRLQRADLAAAVTSSEFALEVDGCIEDLLQFLLLDMASNVHVVHVVVDVTLVSRQSHQVVSGGTLLSEGFLSQATLHDRVVCIRAEKTVLSQVTCHLAITLDAAVLLQRLHLHVVRSTNFVRNWWDWSRSIARCTRHLWLVAADVIERNFLAAG